MDFQAVKAKQKASWESGRYGRLGNRLTGMAERLCEAVDVRASDRVLDVATGTGNAALAAARRHADVIGLDYAPGLLEEARRRAEAEQVDVRFDEGDAERLPYADGAFDVVLSTVGVMFAPDQEKAASEMLRVCRSDGRIGLANWTPEGFIGQLLRTVGKHVPPPAGVRPAVSWGDEARLRQLLGEGVANLEIARRQHVFHYRSPTHFVDEFAAYYGPMERAFASLDPDRGDELRRDLETLVESSSSATGGAVAIPADYLEVVATRR